MAFRTAEGCLTSGQWFLLNELKVEASMSKTARFVLHLRQNEDDISSFDYLDLWFRFHTGAGTYGVMFRPFHDKARQDFALAWELGADTTALQIQAVFGLEDLFNNLWVFRQVRVGNLAEPYLRHPWEPALRVVSRHDHWRAEVAGQYLTPSLKEVQAVSGNTERSLWGTWGAASLEMEALGFAWDVRTQNRQARSTDGPQDHSGPDAQNYRRSWSVETGARHPIAPKLEAEARWTYMERHEGWGEPTPASFDGVDRVTQLETVWRPHPTLTMRLGGMYDQITIAGGGPPPYVSEGSRKESRAYVGVAARFGRVSAQAIEAIELDIEPYPVWFHHDKAFFQIQAAF
jgi:hypothetical protein